MTRLNLVLLIAILASALYLVRTQYESRRLYVELEKAAAQNRKLEADNERLQVEKRAQATPLRVEKLAKESLHMRTATPAITQYATDNRVSKAASSSADGASRTSAISAPDVNGRALPKAREAASVVAP